MAAVLSSPFYLFIYLCRTLFIIICCCPRKMFRLCCFLLLVYTDRDCIIRFIQHTEDETNKQNWIYRRRSAKINILFLYDIIFDRIWNFPVASFTLYSRGPSLQFTLWHTIVRLGMIFHPSSHEEMWSSFPSSFRIFLWMRASRHLFLRICFRNSPLLVEFHSTECRGDLFKGLATTQQVRVTLVWFPFSF